MKKIIVIFFLILFSFQASAENIAEKIKSLNELYKSGAITKDQYNKKKTQLIKGEKIKKFEGDVEGLLFILEESNTYGIKIDYNIASKQYGYKNFKEFVKDYSRVYGIPNLTEKKLKKILKETDSSVEVVKVKKIPKDFNPGSVEYHISMLGTFSKPTKYPEGMLKTIGKGSKSFDALAMNAAKKMSLIFRRTDQYNQRHPGKMLHALAYFELFYQYQLKKKKKKIETFLENWPEKKRGGKTIVTLLKFNKARKKMREALGMDLNTSTEEAMETFWALGDYLEKGKVVKKKVHPDIKKRKKLLSKYKARIADFKSKLETKKDNELYDQIYISTQRKFKLSKLKRKKLYE